MKITLSDMTSLLDHIREESPEIVVVEGYNGVGKSRVIEAIQREFSIRAYRPDYTGWAKRIPAKYRWSIHASILSAIGHPADMMLFDRGIFSGVVYNSDFSLVDAYIDLSKDRKIMQILVTCGYEDYQKFLLIRGSDKELSYTECEGATETYRTAYQKAGVPYVEFVNVYQEDVGREHRATCRGCSHYNLSDSYCKHSSMNCYVDPTRLRCEHTQEKEVQDLGEL